jgi:hypothetical protein
MNGKSLSPLLLLLLLLFKKAVFQYAVFRMVLVSRTGNGVLSAHIPRRNKQWLHMLHSKQHYRNVDW